MASASQIAVKLFPNYLLFLMHFQRSAYSLRLEFLATQCTLNVQRTFTSRHQLEIVYTVISRGEFEGVVAAKFPELPQANASETDFKYAVQKTNCIMYTLAKFESLADANRNRF